MPAMQASLQKQRLPREPPKSSPTLNNKHLIFTYFVPSRSISISSFSLSFTLVKFQIVIQFSFLLVIYCCRFLLLFISYLN